MTVGTIFFILSALLFFLRGVSHPPLLPNVDAWAFFCLVMGFLTSGYPLPPRR